MLLSKDKELLKIQARAAGVVSLMYNKEDSLPTCRGRGSSRCSEFQTPVAAGMILAVAAGIFGYHVLITKIVKSLLIIVSGDR